MSTSSRFGRSIRILFLTALVAASLAASSGCTKSKKDTPNTLHIPVIEKIKGLDPVFADDIYSGEMVSYAYEGLLQYSYLKRPLVLEPNLAEAMPKVSPDGTTYTFQIKKGVLFQDDPCFKESGGKGRELTADDFIYSWKRLADPKTTAAGWWILDGKVVGLNEWREEASKSGTADYSKAIEGLKAVDRYTLQIKLLKRSAQFLYNIAQQFAFVVSKEAVDAYGKEFINNGNSKLIWVRNPTYRKELYPSEGAPGDKEAGLLEDAGKPIPFLDKIVVQVFVEQQPMWLTFLSGKIDTTTIPKDSFDQAVTSTKELKPELKEKGIKLGKSVDAEVTHMSFNMADPLMGKNKYLRQALSLSYDSPSAIQLFYNGRAIPAQGPIPPGLAGYDENFKNPYRQLNVAKAKELLAKAGFPGGKDLPALEYATLADSTSRQFTEFDQKQFAAIGVTLKVNTYSWPEFQAAIKNKRGQLWSYAWTADYPDAENFLQLFYSKNASPGPNDENYSNPVFDKLYEKSLTMSDTPERTALYKQMVQILVEDCPWIFGAHRVIYTLSQPWVRNFKRNQFDLGRAKYYRIDVAAASAKK
jgi:oligopeptide transport system substrate-binding protein